MINRLRLFCQAVLDYGLNSAVLLWIHYTMDSATQFSFSLPHQLLRLWLLARSSPLLFPSGISLLFLPFSLSLTCTYVPMNPWREHRSSQLASSHKIWPHLFSKPQRQQKTEQGSRQQTGPIQGDKNCHPSESAEFRQTEKKTQTQKPHTHTQKQTNKQENQNKTTKEKTQTWISEKLYIKSLRVELNARHRVTNTPWKVENKSQTASL